MKIKPNSWHYKVYMFGHHNDFIRYDDSRYLDYRSGRISKEEYDNMESISHIPKDLCTYGTLVFQTLCWITLVCTLCLVASFIVSSIMIVPFIGLLLGFETDVVIYAPISILVIVGLVWLLQKWIDYRREQRYATSLLPDEEKEDNWYHIIDVYYSSIKDKMCVKLEVKPEDFK